MVSNNYHHISNAIAFDIRFHSNFWTECHSMGHDHSSHGTEGQGQGLSSKRSQWDLDPQSREVFYWSEVFAATNATLLICII